MEDGRGEVSAETACCPPARRQLVDAARRAWAPVRHHTSARCLLARTHQLPMPTRQRARLSRPMLERVHRQSRSLRHQLGQPGIRASAGQQLSA